MTHEEQTSKPESPPIHLDARGWLSTYGDEVEHSAENPLFIRTLAENSYTLADAMLLARTVKP